MQLHNDLVSSNGQKVEDKQRARSKPKELDDRVASVSAGIGMGIQVRPMGGPPLTPEQLSAMMRLEPLEFNKAAPPKRELYKFTEKESKWLGEMFSRRGLGNEVDFLSLWAFDLFELSKQLSNKASEEWGSWQKSFLNSVLSAFLSFNLSESEIKHEYYTRGGEQEIGEKLLSTRELAYVLKDLRAKGVTLVKSISLAQKSTRLREFYQERWEILSAGLDLGMRLFLDKKAKIIFTDNTITSLNEQFTNSHVLKKDDARESFDELIKYVGFFVELIKKTVDKHNIKINFEEIIDKINLLKKPITQQGLQQIRKVLVKSGMHAVDPFEAQLSSILTEVQNGTYPKKELEKVLKRKSKKEFIQQLDKQIKTARIMRCYLLEINRLFDDIASSALPNTYLHNKVLCSRIQINLLVYPETNSSNYLKIFNNYYNGLNHSKNEAAILSNLNEEIIKISDLLICRSMELFAVHLPLEKLKEVIKILKKISSFGELNEFAGDQDTKLRVLLSHFKDIQEILKSVNLESCDFSRIEKEFAECFYQAFTKLPASFVIKNKEALLQLASDLMLFSLKHMVATLRTKDDLAQIFGDSVRSNALEDLLPDGLIDCVNMERLEERLNKWIEEVAPSPPAAVAAPVSSPPLSLAASAGPSAPSEEVGASPVASSSPPSAQERPASGPPEIFISLPKSSIPERSKAQPKPQERPEPAPASSSASQEEGLFDDLRRQRGIKVRKLRAEIAKRLCEFGISDAYGKRRSSGSHAKVSLGEGSGSAIIPRHDQFAPGTLQSILDQIEALAKEAQKK